MVFSPSFIVRKVAVSPPNQGRLISFFWDRANKNGTCMRTFYFNKR